MKAPETETLASLLERWQPPRMSPEIFRAQYLGCFVPEEHNMTFVEKIKDSLSDRQTGINPSRVLVDRQALQELLTHFERLDAEARSTATSQSMALKDPRKALHDAVLYAYHSCDNNIGTVALNVMQDLAILARDEEERKRWRR